jgi:hypothetical protein
MCQTCRRGCGCTHTDPGCGHYGCYGRGPRDCPGADAEERRYAAILARQRRDRAAQRLRRSRMAATFRTMTTAYGLPGGTR